MLNYLLLSTLLSIVGASIYFLWLRKRLSATQSKLALSLVLVLSWTIPFVTPSIPHYSEALVGKELFLYEEYNAWNVVDIEDKKLQECYKKAEDSKDICGCELVQKADLITFQQDPFYNFLLKARLPLLIILGFAAFIFLLEFLIKLGFLIYIVITGYRIKAEMDGVRYYLLYPNTKVQLPLSAFTLWHHYIIWSPILDELSVEEREAAILHEVAHLKQRDSWQQMFLQFSKLGWWMSPIFYLIQKEFLRLNEFVADEFAAKRMGNTKRYAHLLLKVKEQQQKPSFSFALSFAQSLLKKRVLHLIKQPEKKKASPIQLKSYLLLLVLVLWATSNLTQPLLQKQDLKVKQYEVLKSESGKSGEKLFCPNCWSENLDSSEK
jgi:hypothetical protein